MDGLDLARLGAARQARYGETRLGMARRGRAGEIVKLIRLDIRQLVTDIQVNEMKFGMRVQLSQIVHQPRLQVVDAPHLMTFANQAIAQMRSDKSRAARDYDFHRLTPMRKAPNSLVRLIYA